ncbi:MAG: hypothetical protein K2O67_03215 [Clostridia bacterium]|nr:hypothetical protein [Clostridia bacterium]
MRWTKRLKWIRASKIIIPIALAISIVFAGFTVYAHKAENFVVRINNNEDIKLALTMNRDLSGQTSRLVVPVNGRYGDETYTPNKKLLWGQQRYGRNLPDDIAKQDGEHTVYRKRNEIAFFSFSFWLVNNSKRAVDVDIIFNIDEMTISDITPGVPHIDDAVRVMFIEDEPLLSDNSYLVYKKAEADRETDPEMPTTAEGRENWVKANAQYGNTLEFASDLCVFERREDRGLVNFAKGATKRFTVVIWLEGHDLDCIDDIRYDSLKLSLDFQGH